MRNELPIALALLCLSAACASSPGAPAALPGEPPPVASPARLCQDPSLEDGDFCMPVERLEAMMRSGKLDVLHVKVTESGFSRPNVVRLGYPDDGPDGRIVIKAKWKIAPDGGAGFNNLPHKELAAYEAQKLFLEPSEYLVPPTFGACVPVEDHTRMVREVEPNLPGTRCVFGLVAYWVESVTDENARDMERFRSDAAYRAALGDLNLFTYLIDHRDPRGANFLVSRDPERPRLFAIDNGLAFGGFKNPFTVFIGDWSSVRVPALPRDRVERLRRVTRADLERLAIVAQYENRDGLLVAVPPTAPLSDDAPVRITGELVQFGLTRDDIDQMEARIRELLRRVDAGEIELF